MNDGIILLLTCVVCATIAAVAGSICKWLTWRDYYRSEIMEEDIE